jgi:hypothetical protein
MNKARGEKLLSERDYWKRRCKAAEKAMLCDDCYTVDHVMELINDWKKIAREAKK